MRFQTPIARHTVARIGRACVAGAVFAAFALTAAQPAAAADRTKSFVPVRKTNHALVFRLRGVDADKVVGARARLHARRGQRRFERHVSIRRVRSAASRHHRLLSVAKPRSVAGGRLNVELVAPQDSTAPAGTPGDCAGVDAATLTAPGCNVLRDDTSSASDPEAGLWGNIECASDSRYQYETADGDPSPVADGSAQGNDAFRRLTAMDGDDFWGERCELGRNTSRYGDNTGSEENGTFALYGEGEHRITFFSERYPTGFSTGNLWQTIAQIKQAQPADNPGNGPVLELQLYNHQLKLQNNWQNAWTTAAPEDGRWIRYAMDVVYSPDPAIGSVQVFVDLNGDGDALDEGEQSPRLAMATQIVETAGPNGSSDGMAPGDAIPDHLRLGLYHSPSISCPPPTGCSVDVDNVQVAG